MFTFLNLKFTLRISNICSLCDILTLIYIIYTYRYFSCHLYFFSQNFSFILETETFITKFNLTPKLENEIKTIFFFSSFGPSLVECLMLTWRGL